MRYSVFLSHGSTDASVLERVELALWQEGMKPYAFEYDPSPGESVAEKIEDAIRDSDVVVVLVTENSQHSEWVNAEVGFARAQEKAIIPVVDKRISHPVLPFLRDAEYIKVDLDNVDAALPALVRDLVRRRLRSRVGWAVFCGVVGYALVKPYLPGLCGAVCGRRSRWWARGRA